MERRQLQILLVDENEHDYTIIRNLLVRIQEWEFNLEWVFKADRALEKLANHPYTTCLFNYEQNGAAFIQQAQARNIHIPLIAVTETENQASINEAMGAGAVDYLIKSQLTASLLNRAMRYAVQYNQLMAANAQLKQEVVETKRSEAEVRERSRQYQMLFDVNIYAVEVLDIDGRLTDCNPMYLELLGYCREEVIGQPALSFMSERSRVMLERKANRVTENDAQVESEVEFVHKAGGVTMVWRRAKAIYDETGKMKGWVAYSRDISERMKAVKQISVLARALEQSPMALLITDYRGRVEYVNFEFTELTGYTYDEAEGQHIRTFKLKHLPNEMYEELWETINEGDEWKGEYQNYRKNEEQYWETITVTPILNSRGNLTHFIVMQEDITKRLQAEAEFLQSQRRMGHLMSGQIADLTALNEQLQQEIEERKRVEKVLQRSRARLKAQYKGIPIPTYSWQISGEDFVLVDYNHAAEKSSNGHISDILGKSVNEVFKDRTQVRADFERCAREKAIIKREAPYRLIATNETRHFVTTYNYVPPNLILVHIEDVTHHKQAAVPTEDVTKKLADLKSEYEKQITQLQHSLQQEVKQRQQVERILAETEERMKQIADNIDGRMKEQYRGIPIPTYSWQWIAGEFILVDFNDAAAVSMGRIVDFFGRSASEIFRDRPQILADFERCYSEKRTIKREAPYTLVTTGETRYFVTTYLYLAPNMVIDHIQDITEYKAVEQELEKCRYQVELLGQAQGVNVVELAGTLHDEMTKRQQLEADLQENLTHIKLLTNKSELAAKLAAQEALLKQETAQRQQLELALQETQHRLKHEKHERNVELETAWQAEKEKNKQLEAALRKNHDKLKHVVDNIDNRLKEQYRGIPIPTYSWQWIAGEFILVDFNDAAAASMGRIVDFFGKAASEIFRDRPQILADFETCFKEKRIIKREAPYTLVTSGEERYFVTTYLYLAPNMVIDYIQDITEYKEIEHELAQYKSGELVSHDKVAELEAAFHEEVVKRERAERLFYDAQQKFKQSTKWLKVMAQDHKTAMSKLTEDLQLELNIRQEVEKLVEKLQSDLKAKQEQLNNLTVPDMSEVAMINERLQQELGQLQRAEETVRNNRARLKAQYKSIPIPTYSWQWASKDFILVDYNDAADQASQGRIFELTGKKASEAFHDRPQILKDLHHCYQEKIALKRDANYQLVPTDENRHFIISYNFVPPNLVIVYVQDVTAQKQTEQALLMSEEQITLHCRLSPEATLTFVNDAYCWYFNAERADLMGRFMPFVYIDDLPKVRAHFASLRSEDNPVGAIEYRVRRPDDSVRWQQWITLPMFDKLGNLVEIQAIGRDITRRKELG